MAYVNGVIVNVFKKPAQIWQDLLTLNVILNKVIVLLMEQNVVL